MLPDLEESVSYFRHLAADHNVCPELTESELRSEIGFILYVFDVRHRNGYSAAHLVKLAFSVTAEIEVSSYAGFAFVLKN